MRLRPSKIRYSQDSISNRFCDGELIGDVLDDLCDGRIRKRDFPIIEVAFINGRWYTADNRRLWVFQQLEELGKCRKIPVDEIYEIPSYKMTTRNGGRYVTVRGYPGGEWIQELESSSYGYSSIDDDFYNRFQNFRM
ncbi:hypothetical protein ACF0H5_010264 [Mactra antiquata]